MKHGPVVPHIESAYRLPFQQVRLDEVHVLPALRKPTAHGVKCRSGHIEDGQILKQLSQQHVDQRRGSRADIED